MATIAFYEIMDTDFTGIEIYISGTRYTNFTQHEDEGGKEAFCNQSYKIADETAKQLITDFECKADL